jgi:hypothetical protein
MRKFLSIPETWRSTGVRHHCLPLSRTADHDRLLRRCHNRDCWIRWFAFHHPLPAWVAAFSGHALGGRLLLGMPARHLRKGGRLPHRRRVIPAAGNNPLAVR